MTKKINLSTRNHGPVSYVDDTQKSMPYQITIGIEGIRATLHLPQIFEGRISDIFYMLMVNYIVDKEGAYRIFYSAPFIIYNFLKKVYQAQEEGKK